MALFMWLFLAAEPGFFVSTEAAAAAKAKRRPKIPVCQPGDVLAQGNVAVRANGCGLASLLFVQGMYDYTPCCDLLDTCFDVCGSTHSTCHAKFYHCVMRVCSAVPQPSEEGCRTHGHMLFFASFFLSLTKFIESQQRACTCVPREKAMTHFFSTLTDVYERIAKLSGPVDTDEIGDVVARYRSNPYIGWDLLMETFTAHPEIIDGSRSNVALQNNMPDPASDSALPMRKK